MLSQDEFFRGRLQAPLKNTRWSWGGVRERDQVVFLRVWQDHVKKVDGRRIVWLADNGLAPDDLGGNERLSHIEKIKAGYRCFLVMCRPTDSDTIPRQVASFNQRHLFVGGDLVDDEEGTYIELVGKVTPHEIAT